MYLMDSNATRVNNRKWNLGRMGGRMGLQPVRLPNLGRMGASSTAQPWRMRGMRGLGDIPFYGPLAPNEVASPDGSIIQNTDTGNFTDLSTGIIYDNQGNQIANMPSLPSGAQNPSPVTGGASNGGITTVLATQPSTNPLDYTSPQAAIAAGLDAATVYSKWTASLARFSSPQAAISAGVPAGVVNQLWQQSYQNAANKAAAAPSGSIFGLSTGTLLAAGAGLFAIAALGGGRGRRR
jgi:hypothetical protein